MRGAKGGFQRHRWGRIFWTSFGGLLHSYLYRFGLLGLAALLDVYGLVLECLALLLVQELVQSVEIRRLIHHLRKCSHFYGVGNC